jgi:hypothetical protein
VVGFIDDDIFKQGTRIYGSEVIGTCKDISKMVEKHDVGVIVWADHTSAIKEYRTLLDQCKTTLARLVVIPDVFATLNGAVMDSRFGWQVGSDGRDKGTNPSCRHCLARVALLGMNAQAEKIDRPVETAETVLMEPSP